MTTSELMNQRMVDYLGILVKEGFQNAAKGFSGMLGQQLHVADPELQLIPLLQITNLLGGPEDEVVGIYICAEGDLASQFMLIIPIQRAIELADLLLDQPVNSTTELTSLERSALAEVGNLTVSFFMNAIAALSGISLRPTAPAVIVDMVGAIFDIVIATAGAISDSVIMVKTKFVLGRREVGIDFWVIPDDKTLQLLATRI